MSLCQNVISHTSVPKCNGYLKLLIAFFHFWKILSRCLIPAHSLVWILLLLFSFPFQCPLQSPPLCQKTSTVLEGYIPSSFFFLLRIINLIRTHGFYYYLFLDDSQMTISSPYFSSILWIRISNYLLYRDIFRAPQIHHVQNHFHLFPLPSSNLVVFYRSLPQ